MGGNHYFQRGRARAETRVTRARAPITTARANFTFTTQITLISPPGYSTSSGSPARAEQLRPPSKYTAKKKPLNHLSILTKHRAATAQISQSHPSVILEYPEQRVRTHLTSCPRGGATRTAPPPLGIAPAPARLFSVPKSRIPIHSNH